MGGFGPWGLQPSRDFVPGGGQWPGGLRPEGVQPRVLGEAMAQGGRSSYGPGGYSVTEDIWKELWKARDKEPWG